MVICIISASVSINLLVLGIVESFKATRQHANYELLNCKSNSSDYNYHQDNHDENKTSTNTTSLPCTAEMEKVDLSFKFTHHHKIYSFSGVSPVDVI